MSFTTPAALLLLLVLPAVAWLVWPTQPRRTAARPRPRSGWLGLALRLLILALLILSLAGAQLVRAVDDLAVVFLVDASDSMSRESAAAAEAFVREAVGDMGPDDRAAVVLFGANALVEQPLRHFGSAGDLPPFASQPGRLNTNLAEALRLSLALLPAGTARRVVVLSDGAATTGDTPAAARLAAAAGVSIDTVYLPRPAAINEVILRDVVAPARVGQGETFRLEIAAESTTATTATLRVLGDEAVVYEEEVQLQPGANNFVVRLGAATPAFARYRVQLAPAPAADTFPQNNELAAFTEITGQPRVLLVAAVPAEDAPDEAAQLAAALAASGLTVERTTPAELSPALDDLADYAGVFLVNVNARDLSLRKMAALQAYVRDLGGGLTAIGGPDSFGMGGYFATPLEEALPVDMQIHDEERFPSVSLVLVIDRSGSMTAEEGGVMKIQLAAEGAVRALELLNPGDEMTLIPVDEAADDIIGPVTTADRDSAIAQMRALGAGGGGIFVRTGLQAAAGVLASSDREVKHIVVLADGADAEEKEGVPELIGELTAQGITVSMVSIGQGPDTPWLRQMAELGNGRFHLTNEAANLPQIFTQETAAIQRSYLVEERFFPAQVASSPILAGIRETPALYGYVATSAKATAQVALETPRADPLLALWQYGLGRSLAWTSDATGRWAQDWVRWGGFATFWNQAARWTFGNRGAGGLAASVRLDGERARLTVDAQDTGGAFLNDLTLSANVVSPSGETQTVALAPVAPGRYEGAFTPATEGAYFIGVGTTADGQQTAADPAAGGLQTTAGWVLGYSPEYAALSSDPALLASLAAQTGGRALAPAGAGGPGPAVVFDHNLDAAPAGQPLWPWLTLAAALLLPLDVAARRLQLTRREWERIRNVELGMWNRKRGSAEPERERVEGMATLLQAKERATVGRFAKSPAPTMSDERRVTNAESASSDVDGARPVAPSQPPAADVRLPTAESRPPTTGEATPATDERQSAAAEETLAARLRRRREG
ncbi:MAG TPA: VWA domain-containing protein [Promineifilum sp.]|nr:VWA domain-containing protein [Promineifilum sp.]